MWNLMTDRDKGNDRSVLTNEKFSDQDRQFGRRHMALTLSLWCLAKGTCPILRTVISIVSRQNIVSLPRPVGREEESSSVATLGIPTYHHFNVLSFKDPGKSHINDLKTEFYAYSIV